MAQSQTAGSKVSITKRFRSMALIFDELLVGGLLVMCAACARNGTPGNGDASIGATNEPATEAPMPVENDSGMTGGTGGNGTGGSMTGGNGTGGNGAAGAGTGGSGTAGTAGTATGGTTTGGTTGTLGKTGTGGRNGTGGNGTGGNGTGGNGTGTRQ